MSDVDQFLTGDHEKDTRRVTYLIFISGISLLSLVVSILYYVIQDPEVSQVLLILDTLYALFFLFDFIQRMRHASKPREYFIRRGWIDLLTSIPGWPVLRVFRSLSAIYSSRRIRSVAPSSIEQQALSNLAESVLYIIVYIGLIVLSVGSIAIVYLEADAPASTITSGSDAIWWSLVTVSTVGYGDEVPVTNGGRVIGVFMIVVGVALFTTLTSYLASNFTGRGAREQREEQLEVSRQNAQILEQLVERITALEEQIGGAGEEDGEERP